MLTGPHVEANYVAALRLAVNGVRIHGIDLRVKTIAAGRANPVSVGDALTISRLTRPAPAAVVLQAAVDVVKRLPHVRRDRVVLRDGEVGNEVDGATTIVTDVDAAVAADDEMIGIRRIDPHRVMIGVRRTGGIPESATAIGRDLQRHPHEIHAIGIRWIDPNLAHVPWIRERRPGFLPARAAIIRTIDARFGISLRGAIARHLRFDRRVDDIRARPADIETNSSYISFGQSFGEPRPCISSVGALPDATARPAADVSVRPPLTLQRCGVNRVGIRGIEDDVGESGVLVDVFDVLPRLATVGGAKQSTITTRAP